MTDDPDDLDRYGTYFIPDGETRTIQFIGGWLAYRNGNLWTLVLVAQAESDEPLLLNQYQAEDLYIHLRTDPPDPSQWFEVSRDGGHWDVERPDLAEDASDAM